MGQGKTIIKEIVRYEPDPEVAKVLEDTRKELELMRKRYTDPTEFTKNEEKLFEGFLKNIGKCEFKDNLIERKNERERHIAFLGEISTGKSSILNALAKKKVAKVGMGETTKEVKKVFEKNDYHFYDVPGNNKAHNYLDIDNLSFLKALDKVFVLYNSSPKDAERLIRVSDTLNVKFHCVRTFCDNIDVDDEKGVKETIQDDIREIKGMVSVANRNKFKVFGISARNVSRRVAELYDWNLFIQEIFRD